MIQTHVLEKLLVQHTPILHFQHNQDGATLRVTEVKPKLDRFIVDDFPRYWPEDAKLYTDLIELIKDCSDNKKPSPYKLTIQENGNPSNIEWYYFDSTKPSQKSFNTEITKIRDGLRRNFGLNNVKIFFDTPYFANRDKVKDNKWKEIKLGKLSYGKIALTITSFNKKLLEMLDIVISLFFITENFGTRQNKGFGGYVVDKQSDNELFEKVLKRKYEVVKKISLGTSEKSIEAKFNVVNKAYKQLKNFPNKDGSNNALIKEYYESDKQDSIFWEKDLMSDFAEFGDSVREDDEYYVRVVLGLANLYDYPHFSPRRVLNIIDLENDEEKKIERFKSPIFFKIFNDVIYLVCNDIPKDILAHEFTFKRDDGKELTIKTPWYFNKNEFLNKLNWKNV